MTGRYDGLRTKVEVKNAYQRKHIQNANEILRSDNEIFFRRLQNLQKSIQPIQDLENQFSINSQDLEKFAKELCKNDPRYNVPFVVRHKWNENLELDAIEEFEAIMELIAEARSLQNWVSPLIKLFGEISNDTLNNDLDDFFEDLCRENDKKGMTETPIERKLVLYEMLEDGFNFMKSKCKRFTVNLK